MAFVFFYLRKMKKIYQKLDESFLAKIHQNTNLFNFFLIICLQQLLSLFKNTNKTKSMKEKKQLLLLSFVYFWSFLPLLLLKEWHHHQRKQKKIEVHLT